MSADTFPATSWHLLDHLEEGVIIAETDGRVLYSNHTARSLLGLDPLGTPLADVSRQLIANGAIDTRAAGANEWRIPRPDQQPLTVRMVPQQGPDGELTQILITPGDSLSSEKECLEAQISDAGDLPGSLAPELEEKIRLILETVYRSGWRRVFLAVGESGPFTTRSFGGGDKQSNNEPFPPRWIWHALAKLGDSTRIDPGSSYLLTPEKVRCLQSANVTADGGLESLERGSPWPADGTICIPLFGRQQERAGWMGVASPHSGRSPGSEDLSFLQLQARLLALEATGAEGASETFRRNQQLENLLRAGRRLSGELEQESVLALLGDQMFETTRAHICTIFEWDREKGALRAIWGRREGPEQSVDLPDGLFSLTEASPLDALLKSEAMSFVRQSPGDLPEGLRARLGLAPSTTASLLYIPVRFSDYTFGLVEIVTSNRDIPEAGALELLLALADQAGTALETALMFEDAVEREHFYNALGRVSLAMNFALAKESVLDLIALESLRIFGVEGAFVFQAEGDRFVGVAAAGVDDEGFAGTSVSAGASDAFVSAIAKQGIPAYQNQLGPREQSHLFLPRQESAAAVLGVPFEQDGVVSGVLVLVDRSEPDRFSEKDVTRASVFGAQVAIALRNASLFEELRRFNEELDRRVAERTQALNEESNRVKILLRITSELTASLDQDHVINRALRLVKEAVEATEGVILLINPETDDLEFRAALGRDEDPMPALAPSGLKRDAGLAGWMIENRSAVLVEDTRQDSRWLDLPRSRALRSVLGVPLITSDEVIGVLMLFHIETDAFTSQQMDLVEAAAIQVANAISNANLYLLIRDQAESLGKVLLAEQIEAAKSQSILESIADGVVVADADSRIILANVAASSILELPREGFIGKSVNELLGLYGQAGRSWMTTISDWSANADRIEQGTFLSDELTIEDKVVSLHLSPVLAGRQYFGTVSIFRDITQNVELDKLKSEFVSTVSHELRTPMTSIKGYAELMLMGAAGKMSETQRRYLQVISNNAERLHMLVNDLLDISRMETGKTELDLRPTHVARLVEQVVEGHLRGRIQHEKKQIDVHVEMAPALPLVNADQVRFSQILTNLLDNAFNYTPENGAIRIYARALDGFVQIGVADTGIGIPEEIQAKIYDRFFRAEDTSVQQIPGTGLGLAIVRSLVAMHGGRLNLESTPGQGSCFMFTLPVVVDDSEPT